MLSNRLSDMTLLATELFEVFHSILKTNPDMVDAAMADLWAIRERDPACASYSQALLYFKGYHAIQAHRIAHYLWHCKRRVMAVALQSKVSEVFAVDIHPAATIGKGVLLDHGTGIVIGETAEVGNNVSILQNVTLGGTGKQTGDRHPKVSDNVLIGASATILGSIQIGRGAQVAAGSLVLKPVPPKTMVAGSPAKEVGQVKGNPARNMEQWTIGVGALEAGKKMKLWEDIMDECDDAGSIVKQDEKQGATAVVDREVGSERLEEEDKGEKIAVGGSGSLIESLAPESFAAVATDAVSTLSKEKGSGRGERSGRPPAEKDHVESVKSDKAAMKKWGQTKKGGGDMEYMI